MQHLGRAMDAGVRNGSSLSYIRGLDGLRAISVVWVIAFHYLSYFHNELASASSPWSTVRDALSLGWVGVDIFLVISGFLITKIILKNPAQSPGYSHFLRRRAWRLLPAYVLLLVIFTAAACLVDPTSKVLHNSWSLWTLTSNVLLSFGDRSALMDNHFAMYHLWSVAIEWHFYAFMPLAIRAFRTPQKAAFLLVVAAIGCRTAFHFLGVTDNAIYAFSLCRIDAFSMGAIVAVAKPMTSSLRLKSLGAAGAACFVLLVSTIATANEPFKTIPWVQTVGYTLIDASVALVVYFVVHAKASTYPIRVLEFSPIRSIGRASYSLYLWHIPFFPMVVLLTRSTFHEPMAPFYFSVLIGLGLTAIAGTISYLFVERVFMAPRPQQAVVAPVSG